MTWAFWLTAVVTVAFYVAIVAWSAPMISGHAGGLLIFDLRPTGYDTADAEAFLAALTEEGRAFYLSVQHRLDLAYPALLAVTTIWAYRLLLARTKFVLTASVLPVAAMIFDYLENTSVAVMLNAGVENLTDAMVSRASMYSVLKSVMTTLSMCLLLVLVLFRPYRKWSARA